MSDYDSYGSDFEDSGGILDGRNTTTSRYSGQVQTAVPENVAVPPPQTRTLYSADSERKSHDLSLGRNDGSRNSSRIPLRRSRDSSRAENGYKGTSNTSNVLATAGLASFDRADSKSAHQRNGKPPVDRNTESSEETIQKLRLANSALRRQVQQLSTALEEAQVRHTTTSRLSDNGSLATESPAMERKRFLQELGSKDKQIRMLTKKLDNLRRSLKAKKEQLDVTLAGDRVVQLENQKRDLERQLGALADENKALLNMQRQLIKRVDEEEQLHGELPHKIQSLSEDVRVLKDKLRTAKANESQAQAQFDKQRARMMKIIDVNRQYKQKLRNVRSKLSKQRNLSKLGSPLISGLSTPASSPPNSARFSQARTVSQNVFDSAQDAWDKEKRQLQKQLKDLKARLSAAPATSPSAKHFGTNTSSGQAKSTPSGKHQRSPAKATSDASRAQKQAHTPVDTIEHTATSQDTSNYMQTPEASGSNNNDARDSKYSPLQTGKRTATPTSKASHAESKDAENASNDKNTLNVSPKPPAAQGGLAGLDYSNIMDSGAASDADDDDDEYGDEDDFEDTKNSNEESMLAALNDKQLAPEPTFPTTNNTNTSSTGMQNAQTDMKNGTKSNSFRFGQSGTSSDPYDYKPSFLAGDGGNTDTDNKNSGMNDPMKQNINSRGNGIGMNTGNGMGMNNNSNGMGMNTGNMGMNAGGMGMNNNSNGMSMNTGNMGMNTGNMGMNTGGMGMNNNSSGMSMGMNIGMNTGGIGMNGNQNNFGSSNMNSNGSSSQPSWLSSKSTVGGASADPASSMNTMGTNNQSKISTTGIDDTPSWLRNDSSTTGLGSNTNVGGIGGNTQINGIGNFSSVGGGNVGVSGMTNPPGTFNTGNTFGNNMTSNGGNAFSKPTFGSSALGGGKTNYDSLFS